MLAERVHREHNVASPTAAVQLTHKPPQLDIKGTDFSRRNCLGTRLQPSIAVDGTWGRNGDAQVLKGERVYLRPLEKSDLAAIVRWDEDDEIIEAMGKKFRDNGECLNWFAAIKPEGRRRVLAIENESGELIGELELDNLSPKEGAIELSICIGNRACWNQGYGTEAIQLVRDNLFQTTRLKRIYLRVYRSNKRAIRCYEKCGFVKEAILPLSQRQVGRRDDVVLMAITRARYIALRERLAPYWQHRRTAGE